MKKRVILIFLMLVILIFLGQYITFRVQETQEHSDLYVDEAVSVSLASSVLTDWIWKGLVDLRYLSTLDSVIIFNEEQKDETQSNVAYDFSKFSKAIAVYDQIRLLDMNGMERVRVDSDENGPVVIPSEQLQDKSDRYYFIECSEIPVGDFYISPIDLNVENNEVEIPYKPMVRICTPIIDQDGNKAGLMILNYLAAGMLDSFSAVDENLMLVNLNGYWLHGPNEDDNWGFMFDREETFSSRYSEEWQTISSMPEGTFETANGLWTYSKVDLQRDGMSTNQTLLDVFDMEDELHGSEALNLTVIYNLPPEELRKIRNKIARPLLFSSLFIYPLVYYGMWNLNKRIETEKRAVNQTRFMATHDMMTSIFNRAFFDTELERLNNSRLYPISVFVMDANDLKIVNDTYGHAEGDKLIQSIATVLKITFRTEDIVARLGGDEFGVLLPQTDETLCRKILTRLLDNIERHNRGGEGRRVDVAIGTATTSGMEDLTEVFKRADERMYAEKAARKKRENRAAR